MDLQKAYDTLDRDQFLDILEGCGMGPWAIRILWTYWGRLTMVAKSVGYHVPPFKGFCEVTQVNPISPMLSNVIVHSIMHHWVTVVSEKEAVPEGLRRSIQHLVDYFCTDGILIASIQAVWIQRSFDVLVDLFNRAGLQTNFRKTVSMVFQPCHSPGGMLEEAYTLRMTGEGPMYQNRLRRRVRCLEYKAKMSTGSLQTHLQTQHSVIRVGRTGNTPPLPPRRPTTTGFPFQRRWT